MNRNSKKENPNRTSGNKETQVMLKTRGKALTDLPRDTLSQGYLSASDLRTARATAKKASGSIYTLFDATLAVE